MSAVRARRSPASRAWIWLVALLLGLVLVAVLVIALFDLWPEPPRRASGPPPGQVVVPLSSVPLRAFEKIRREHLFVPGTTNPSVAYLDPEDVRAQGIMTTSEILGRVLARDKASGYAFTENDFLPPGTREGLVAGIPPGMRAIRLPAERVDGLFGLRAGDRFDLVSTVPLNRSVGGEIDMTGVLGGQGGLSASGMSASVQLIVQNGYVVSPIGTRAAPVFSQTLTRGAINQSRPIQEIVIAVAPQEVFAVTQALAVKAELTCVPRSGNSEEPVADPSNLHGNGTAHPGIGPGGMSVVETIRGAERGFRAVPRSGPDR
ncbi:hypothetical protein ABI59_07225 [Acidobacteria bacterium Mor1]|nr:hypothetical protein ABI59_07225 [Acidobacteria bacterium Mor1]